MSRPRPRHRPRRAPPGYVPTVDDLLVALRADWPRVRARAGFVDRVVLAVRRVAVAGEGPQRKRSRLLVGAAGALLLAFAAGIVEAGRGGVRGIADDVRPASRAPAAPIAPPQVPRPDERAPTPAAKRRAPP